VCGGELVGAGGVACVLPVVVLVVRPCGEGRKDERLDF
jgi:hypothetical protein